MIKRSGIVEPFSREKIVSGVRKGIIYPANASGEIWLMNIRM